MSMERPVQWAIQSLRKRYPHPEGATFRGVPVHRFGRHDLLRIIEWAYAEARSNAKRAERDTDFLFSLLKGRRA